MNSSDENLKSIIKQIYKKKNSFYFYKFVNHGIKKFDSPKIDLKSLPITTGKELALSSFKERCLKEEPGLNKLVFSKKADKYYLIHRNLSEIKNASLPIEGERPLVLMKDVYEAVETCLYFYEKKILPLIGEVLNPAVVYSTAKQYNVDSLYIDHHSLTQFKDELIKLKLGLKSVTVIDSAFSKQDLKWPGNIIVHGILSLPEIGRIATLCPEEKNRAKLVFHPFDDMVVEPSAHAVLTSSRLHACPMLRYQSQLNLSKIDSSCKCGKISLKLTS